MRRIGSQRPPECAPDEYGPLVGKYHHITSRAGLTHTCTQRLPKQTPYARPPKSTDRVERVLMFLSGQRDHATEGEVRILLTYSGLDSLQSAQERELGNAITKLWCAAHLRRHWGANWLTLF